MSQAGKDGRAMGRMVIGPSVLPMMNLVINLDPM